MKSPNSNVVFTVNTEDLKHGHYTIDIAVDEYYIFMYLEKIRKHAEFEVTNYFNGQMQLVQGPNNTIRENGFVSSQSETVHNIIISDKDKKLFERAAYLRVYWFIDCLYVGMTDSLNFTNWYRTENGKYNVEALLMLSYEPLPPPTTSTTPNQLQPRLQQQQHPPPQQQQHQLRQPQRVSNDEPKNNIILLITF